MGKTDQKQRKQMMDEVQQQQLELPVHEQRMIQTFMVQDVLPLPEGGKQMSIFLPSTGVMLSFPMNKEAAEKLGQQMLAPSVEIARSVPPHPEQNGAG